jgi:hypothetical protein
VPPTVSEVYLEEWEREVIDILRERLRKTQETAGRQRNIDAKDATFGNQIVDRVKSFSREVNDSLEYTALKGTEVWEGSTPTYSVEYNSGSKPVLGALSWDKRQRSISMTVDGKTQLLKLDLYSKGDDPEEMVAGTTLGDVGGLYLHSLRLGSKLWYRVGKSAMS